MTLNWRKNAVLRKSAAFARQLPRAFARALASPENYSERPPAIANSFPKSGTHLLLQILEAFPGTKNYGTFLASMPSVTFRERSAARTLGPIRRIAPGELVSAHLFYSSDYADALARKNTAHFFIYRDPRDVVVSEAHYLTKMNRWHRLHRFFRSLPSIESQIAFSITGATEEGFPYDYPNVARRFHRYHEWINHPDVFAIRFEELRGEGREDIVRRIVEFYLARSKRKGDVETWTKAALDSIQPSRSHTFRSGKAGSWCEAFNDEHRRLMKECAGQLLIELGYEEDMNW